MAVRQQQRQQAAAFPRSSPWSHCSTIVGGAQCRQTALRAAALPAGAGTMGERALLGGRSSCQLQLSFQLRQRIFTTVASYEQLIYYCPTLEFLSPKANFRGNVMTFGAKNNIGLF